MKKFRLYTKVQVVKLVQSIDKYDSWRLNKRPPEIGDIGILIDYLPPKGKPYFYIVEKSDMDGSDIWLCDFLEEEIEPFPDIKKKNLFFTIIQSVIPRKHIITKRFKFPS
jgi:hypothetical protein